MEKPLCTEHRAIPRRKGAKIEIWNKKNSFGGDRFRGKLQALSRDAGGRVTA